MWQKLGFAFGATLGVNSLLSGKTTSDGVVKLEAYHKHIPRPMLSHHERSGTASAPLVVDEPWAPAGVYFVQVEVGTPPQKLELVLDSGSPFTWVPDSSAPNCKDQRCPGGTFTAAQSSTFSHGKTQQRFEEHYGDESIVTSVVKGEYANDNITLAGSELKNFEFAVADEIQLGALAEAFGIMGVDYDDDIRGSCEAAREGFPCDIHLTNVPDAMYQQGYIKSRSYSLYLDDSDGKSGSMLFGGIDTAKFTGELTTLESLPLTGIYGSLYNHPYMYHQIYLKSTSASVSGTSAKFMPSQPDQLAVLDSGTNLVVLLPSLYEWITSKLQNLQASPEQGPSPRMPCKDADKVNATLTFELLGANDKSFHVQVPFSHFVRRDSGNPTNTSTLNGTHGEEMCNIAISRGVEGDDLTALILGEPFLWSVYAFHDLDTHTVSLAQASFDKGHSNIIPVGPGPVPSFTSTSKQDNGPGVVCKKRDDHDDDQDEDQLLLILIVLVALINFWV